MEKKNKPLKSTINNPLDFKLENYFKLTEQQKEMVIEDITQPMINEINFNPHLLASYLHMLDEKELNTLEDEVYEGSDIVKRVKEKLINNYSHL